MTQTDRAQRFKQLHDDPGLFVLPNPWDAGSARLLAGLGFQALATTSSGFARTLGRTDYAVTRAEKLDHVRALVAATDLPLSADLENGFGDAPEDCAETIRLGAEAGLVGGSIEDFTGNSDAPQYEVAEAADRVRAAVEAARALPFPFTLTARAENFFTGEADLADTIARLQAYQEAGADVLYAPGLRTIEDIAAVISAVDRPVNVLLGPRAGRVPLSELADLGVKRVSVGGALHTVAYNAMVEAARELLDTGTQAAITRAMSGANLGALMQAGAQTK